jgi:hypothetical protein
MPDEKMKSKAQSVRDYLSAHPQTKVRDVAKDLSQQGINIDAKYVSYVKSIAKAGKSKGKEKSSEIKPKRTGSGNASKMRQPWTFPKNTLEEALQIARAIEDKNAGKPTKAVDLVKVVGFHKASDWRFQDLLRSANQYGLVSGTGAEATVRLQKTGGDIVAPSSSNQRQQALLQAFHNVELFKQVGDFYEGKRTPEDEFFENTLVRDFKIPRDRVKTFIEVYTKNLKYLNLFAARRLEAFETSLSAETRDEVEQVAPTMRTLKKERIREFLDTCFVMMPFGEWFDRYYQEIYIPAIKEAGFEPVRADELFTTGTVVEQVWEQIQKSTVLLADLSEKNANVFYELGLAHAAHKPVVFTASNIEDVPFDLRHLRVIVYDVREPDWAATLGKSVKDYLKNAKLEPIRSIPQPFREEYRESEK